MRSRAYIGFSGVFAVTLAGFWPSFFGALTSNDMARTVHGSFATLWLVLLITQSLLIDRGSRRLHRWLGWASVPLAVLLIGSSLNVVWLALVNPHSPFPPDLLLILTWIDVTSLVLFVALYVAALVTRRRVQLHSRYMTATVFVGMIPALGRLYGMNIAAIGGLRGALGPSFWTVEAALVLLIVYDAARRRFYRPYPLALLAFVAIELSMYFVPQSASFVAAAHAIGMP